MRTALLSLLLSTVLLLGGCENGNPSSGPAAATGTVSGTVTYRERVALPADAVIDVVIVDVTGGANSVVGSQQIMSDGNQVPIAFEAAYATADINPEHDYTVGATIQDGAGKVIFETAESVPVLTKGHPFQDVTVTVVAPNVPVADENAQTEVAADAASGLPGSVWRVVSLQDNPPVEGTTITANFGADGALTGSDGCNQYAATYAVDGATIAITPGPSTLMACPEPVAQQATAYLEALAAAASYTIDGSQFNLIDADGKVLVNFEVTAQELAGTIWQAILYNNGKGAVVSVNVPTITANFGADGTVSGFAGCNDYSGSYATNGDALQIGSLTVTEKTCSEPANIMEEESQFLAALQSAANFQIEGNVLQVQNMMGEIAVQFEQTE